MQLENGSERDVYAASAWHRPWTLLKSQAIADGEAA